MSPARTFICCLALMFAAGCGGGSGMGTPPVTGGTSSQTGTVKLVLGVPQAQSAARARGLKYLSPATQSITINLTPQGSSTPVSGYPQTVGLTTSASGCTSTLASTQCTLTLSLAAGSYVTTLTTYDGANGSGNVLSSAQTVPFTVTAGIVNTVAISLGGVPVSAALIVNTPATMPGDNVNGYTLAAGKSATVTILGVDADNNYILGAGAPTATLTSTNANLYTVTAAGSGAPNTFTVTNASSHPAGARLIGTVTPAAQSGATIATAIVRVVSQTPTLYVEMSTEYVAGYSQTGASSVAAYSSASNPSSAVYDPHNGLLYVTNGGNSTVAAFSPTLGTPQVYPFAGLNEPEGIIFDPNNNDLYVTSEAGNTVTAYNEAGVAQTLSGTFPNLNAPHGIAFDPVNRLIYVACVNSTILAYDENGNQQTLSGTFPGVNGPVGIAYDADNGLLYVVNFSGTTITVYDPNGNAQSPTSFSEAPHATGIAYDEWNGLLYVTDPQYGSVTAFTSAGTAPTALGSSFSVANPPEGIGVIP
jgi:DNA-binding beta-propeller fold protein YncE